MPDESPQILEAARESHISVDALVAQVDALLAEPLYWFGVRHHSPTVARLLEQCIRQRRPKVIFIEGPSEAQGMIEFITDSKTKPPIAIYSSFRHDSAAAEDGIAPQRHSVWYPLVSYSPEYVAMVIAAEVGTKAIFIDLPHYARVGQYRQPGPVRDLDEIAPQSRFFRTLAKAAGFRSWNETWDRLFETSGDEQYETARRNLALFCGAVRATSDAASLESDGTLARERFMWRTIQQTLQTLAVEPKDAMVVCGGFHLFLNRDDPQPLPDVPQGTLSVTVAPYSYFRISELSGYGAGNRAPRFYELCFNHQAAGKTPQDVVIDHIIDVIKESRRHGELLSSADAIAAAGHAMMLSRLRGTRQPVLDDIHDALISCCCKGNPSTEGTRLREAIDEIDIGTKLGRVTDRIGRLPIVVDFYEQLARLDLESVAAREKVQTYALDKRQPIDAQRSAFLHRLIFLGVEIGSVQREAAPFGQSVFREHWRLRWSPGIEPSLIERNLHGDTIEAAATTLLQESLGTNALEAGPACRRLVQAVDMDLPQLVAQAQQATGHAIDHDDRFCSLADALTSLMMLERYAAYRALGKQQLADLIARCFDRACFAAPQVACAPPEQWDEIINALLALAEPVVVRDDLDADLFAAHISQAAGVSTMPFLRGAFLGVLAEMRRIQPAQLAAELTAYARGGVEQQVVAGDFLHGVLRVSRTAIMLGAAPLVAAIDELLRSAAPNTFLSMLPRIRAAFEAMHQRQRDALAAQVAQLYGLKEDPKLMQLTTSIAGARLMAELDAQVATIMQQWLGTENRGTP